MFRRPLAATLTAALLGSGLLMAAAPVSEAASTASQAGAVSAARVAAKPRVFKNCIELNKVYKHGVGRTGAKDKVKGKSKPVKTFKVDTALYNANNKSDGDKDGISCEK